MTILDKITELTELNSEKRKITHYHDESHWPCDICGYSICTASLGMVKQNNNTSEIEYLARWFVCGNCFRDEFNNGLDLENWELRNE